MKRILLASVLVFLCTNIFSQSLSKITIAGRGQVEIFAFSLPENVQLYLTKEGNLYKWGFDKYIGYQENYNNDLEPYVGRVEYYSKNDDEALRGKVKYIGNTLLTYFASYENEILKGKIKSIGTTSIDYYLNYDDAAYRGNLKKIGSNVINWYASFENADIKGKLKNVGATLLTYYGSFEDKAYRGKIKNIGQYSITYFSSFEQYSGSMKTGSTILNVANVKYYIKNY